MFMRFSKLNRLFRGHWIFGRTPFTGRITFFALAFLGFSLFYTSGKFILQNNYLAALISIQILLFGFILKRASVKIFNRIWDKKDSFIRRKWEALGSFRLRLTYFIAYMVITTLAILHILQGFLSRNLNSLFSYEQFSIGFVYLTLTIWFLLGSKKNSSFPRQVALTTFLSMFFVIIYDFFLFEVVQVTDNLQGIGRIEVPIILSLIAIFTMMFPRWAIFPFFNLFEKSKSVRKAQN